MLTMPKRKKMPKGSWARAIQDVREKLDLTQEEFASKVGLPKRTIVSWETGDRKPSVARQKLLLSAFNNLS